MDNTLIHRCLRDKFDTPPLSFLTINRYDNNERLNGFYQQLSWRLV